MDREIDTTNDRSRLFQIIIWFLLVVELFSVGARLGTKYAMSRKLELDDKLMMIAQAIGLIQCVTISIAASQGRGDSLDTLDEDSMTGFLQAEYASTPFLILTLAFVKWSISAFIKQLSPDNVHLRINLGHQVVVGLWLVSGILCSVFQCALPTPWDYLNGARCIDRRAWWTYVVVLNILTELWVVVLYFLIMMHLQISLLRRCIVLAIFSSRLLVVGAASAQLVMFWKAYPNLDKTSVLWLPLILNQTVRCVSITTASIPYLKPFMKSLESGIVRVDDIPESDEYWSATRSQPNRYTLTNMSNSAASCRPAPK